MHFHYRTNSVKINDKFFQYIQKTLSFVHFWPISPIFGAKNFFLVNPALSRTNSNGFLASCQNLEKTNDTIPRKRPDRRKDGRTDRPYFIGPFRLTPGVQKIGSFVQFLHFLPELWPLSCLKKSIFCNFVLTSARNETLLKQFTYMHLKGLVTHFQKMILFIIV